LIKENEISVLQYLFNKKIDIQIFLNPFYTLKMKKEEIKEFYKNYGDKIQDKRLNSPYRIRRYAHLTTYQTILKYIKKDDNVLEVGCGEGILSVMMAKKGARVMATDISEKNIEVAKKLALKQEISNRIEFGIEDVENLSFENDSFDVVVADNILEHLPDIKKGFSEIKRVSRKNIIIALPTCLNACAFCLLGGDVYWKITRKTPSAIFLGFFKVLLGIIFFKKGINEGYGGNKQLPHLWRYPWKLRKELKENNFKIISFEPATLCLPYFSFLLPIIKFLDKYKRKKILRNFGFGSVVFLEKE
jgi:2-polyprenyl-3-methyl-5-hydroxy-6-metoxy-1,4-benzoquinol methylase